MESYLQPRSWYGVTAEEQASEHGWQQDQELWDLHVGDFADEDEDEQEAALPGGPTLDDVMAAVASFAAQITGAPVGTDEPFMEVIQYATVCCADELTKSALIITLAQQRVLLNNVSE